MAMMDPDANLAEQLEIAAYITRLQERDYVTNVPAVAIQATRLAELVRDLDEWMTGGGTLPAAWKK